MTIYNILLWLHIGVVVAYMLLLFGRLFLLWANKEETMLLYSERSKAASILMLGIAVFTGIYLGFHYDFDEGLWFVVKLGLLGLGAFIGDYAFKNFSKIAGVITFLIMLYIIGISITKSLDLVYAY